jgi:hypothetical protein
LRRTIRLRELIAAPEILVMPGAFGNVTNVARTVQLYEKAGVGGLFIAMSCEQHRDRPFSAAPGAATGSDRLRRARGRWQRAADALVERPRRSDTTPNA